MNKELVKKLYQKAEEIATNFSNPERQNNFNKERFMVVGIEPLSETTAAITFLKNTNKLALAFAYYINSNQPHWDYFFPKESHIYGMQKLSQCLGKIEHHNFSKNGC
jgi:hypothetical protein